MPSKACFKLWILSTDLERIAKKTEFSASLQFFIGGVEVFLPCDEWEIGKSFINPTSHAYEYAYIIKPKLTTDKTLEESK